MTEYEEIIFKDGAVVDSKSFRIHELIYDIVSVLISASIAVFVILACLFRVASVVGSSMEPTLLENDRLIITPATINYSHGDIVVIHRENDVSIVKRVIAVPGDTIDIDFNTGTVYLNDKELHEEYIADKTYLQYSDGPTFPVVIPTGYYFVMGDNRNGSLDSRSASIGLINEQYILGKMLIDVNNKEAK